MPSVDLAAHAEALADVAATVHARGGAPATSGNVSVRMSDDRVLITASGRSKAALAPDDLLVIDLEGRVHGTAATASSGRPSAETELHLQLYRHLPDVGCVVHAHGTAAMVLSRVAGDPVVLEGWELQKAFAGQSTHETPVTIPVFDNTQDVAALAAVVQARMDAQGPGVAYLIRGHGVYTWGQGPADALRHLEALDALFDCELMLRRIS